MAIGIYISHPQVEIDPAIQVEQCGLSASGKKRAAAFAARDLLPAKAIIYSSTEKKALDLAYILADVTDSRIHKHVDFGENNRSSTGYLKPDAFESHVSKMFARPDISVAGWETALDAQKRIISATTRAFDAENGKDAVLFCGHGCVGTLLKCHMAQRPITQKQDQREIGHPGGGNLFVFDLARAKLLCDWTAMEDWKGI